MKTTMNEFLNENKINFCELEDNEIKVYMNKLKNIFNFVGDGVYDTGYDIKYNHIWIEFYPDDTGIIELSDWNKVDDILKTFMKDDDNEMLESYKISFRLDLYFNEDYEIGIYD